MTKAGNHNLCTVGLHGLCTTGMHNLCTTGMHNIFSIAGRITFENYEIQPIVNSRYFCFLCIAHVILPQTDPNLLS